MQYPVDVWAIPLAGADAARNLLSEEEIARANRFKFEEDRVRWSVARSALRLVLSKYAGGDPMHIDFRYGEHGKPALIRGGDIEFNLSHAGDWALIAVTRAVPVGVDIERIREKIDMAPLLERLGESNLPAARDELYQRWTQREARSKAAGGALFDMPPDTIRATRLNAPEGYAASVALVGFEPLVNYCGGVGNL
jgi:4'-phosphopantetheinyl transferase